MDTQVLCPHCKTELMHPLKYHCSTCFGKMLEREQVLEDLLNRAVYVDEQGNVAGPVREKTFVG